MTHEDSWRRRLDRSFPTIVRYIGLLLLIYAAVIDRGRNPELIPAATGMIFAKTILGKTQNGNA